MSAESLQLSRGDSETFKIQMLEAQLMTGWFTELFMGNDVECGRIPAITDERVRACVDDGHLGVLNATTLQQVADKIWRLPPDFQEPAIYYFCGYPSEAFGTLTDTSLDALHHELDKVFDVRRSEPEILQKKVGKQAVETVMPLVLPRVPRYQISNQIRSLASAVSADELSWQEQALCAQTDPEAFFPEKGGSTREAKKVCMGCEVQKECLDYALDNDERFGVWGGLSERERRKLKKRTV